MRWLCLFFSCRWLHHFDVMDDPAHYVGLWQCSRCKTISIGRFMDKH